MLATSNVIMYTILLKYGSKQYTIPSPEPILILVSSTSKTLTSLQISPSEIESLNHDRIDL